MHLAALMPPACEDEPLRGYQLNSGGQLVKPELGYQPDYPGVRGVADYVAHLSRLESLPHG
jgi:hypothetical protein